MDKTIINIVDCPTNSYKLTGENVVKYHEEALKKANDLYLNLHNEYYQKLMLNNFNLLWTPDTISTNDIDSKDGFWSLNYFYFNVCLIKILSEALNIKVVDKTTTSFPNQYKFFNLLKNEGIELIHNGKKVKSRFSKQSIKHFIKVSIEKIPTGISEYIDFFKKEYLRFNAASNGSTNEQENKKIIYLSVPPVGNMTLKSYLNWRYRELIKHYEEQGKRIILVATKDFKDSEDIRYSFRNINRLITWKDLICITFKAIYYKLKTYWIISKNLFTPSVSIEEKFFLKNIPTRFFYALKEHYGFNNLFKNFGPGLLLMKGPIISKGASIHIFNAKKYGVRTLAVAGRILTSTRLSNCFLEAHSAPEFPNVLPDSVVVFDRISFETIERQNRQIKIYAMVTSVESQKVWNEDLHDPFSITIALQKRNEMAGMIDEVVAAIQNLDNVILNLKPHPNFKIKKKLVDTYKKMSFINILDMDVSLNEAVEMSDVCITAYSSSAFEFAKKGKPIIWLDDVTLNSLFFSDLFRKLGLVANHSKELETMIRRLKEDSEYYFKERKNQYDQFKNLVYDSTNEAVDSYNHIIDRELEKI